jgi:lipid-binding SYLF domain-containing protein
MKRFAPIVALSFSLMLGALGFPSGESRAAGARELEQDARTALNRLYASAPAARDLSKRAKGVLVFPSVVKAGLMIGGQYGEGVLFKGEKAAGFYNTAGASYGLQAGAQKFGYALFFMNDGALHYLGRSEGLEIGAGPSVVVMDEGMAKQSSTTTLSQDVYAFIFRQQGLMAGLGLQGNKITKIDKR